MKKILALVLVVMPSVLCAAPLTEDEARALISSVKKVDADLKGSAGISIHEVSLLLQGNSHTYQPRWVLERSGELKLLKKMEGAGFIHLRIQKGLPDGSERESEFVSYEATDRGVLIIAALQ